MMTVGKFVPQDWSAPTAKPGMPARRRRGSFGLCLAMAVWTTVMPVDGAVGQTRNDGASGSGNDAAAYEVCIGLANTQPRRALIEALVRQLQAQADHPECPRSHSGVTGQPHAGITKSFSPPFDCRLYRVAPSLKVSTLRRLACQKPTGGDF